MSLLARSVKGAGRGSHSPVLEPQSATHQTVSLLVSKILRLTLKIQLTAWPQNVTATWKECSKPWRRRRRRRSSKKKKKSKNQQPAAAVPTEEDDEDDDQDDLAWRHLLDDPECTELRWGTESLPSVSYRCTSPLLRLLYKVDDSNRWCVTPEQVQLCFTTGMDHYDAILNTVTAWI